MGEPNFKPKISTSGDKEPKLKQAEIDFMKIVEKKNLDRVNKLNQLSRKNRLTAGAIGCSVLGIYFYSMYAVKQETFLDDFNEPVKVQQ